MRPLQPYALDKHCKCYSKIVALYVSFVLFSKKQQNQAQDNKLLTKSQDKKYTKKDAVNDIFLTLLTEHFIRQMRNEI